MQNSNILKNTLVTWFQNHLKSSQSSSTFKKKIHIMVCMPIHSLTYVQKGYMVNGLIVVC